MAFSIAFNKTGINIIMDKNTEYNPELINEKFTARDLALTVALATLNKRLDGMNEFRDALKDQGNTFMPRVEYSSGHDSLVRSVDQLRLDVVTYATKVEAFDKSSSIDRSQLDRRLEGMNEFRAQLKDQAATFVTRSEYTAAHDALVTLFNQLKDQITLCVTRVENNGAHETLTELYNQLRDQSVNFLSRGEYTSSHEAVVKLNDQVRLDLISYNAKVDAYDKATAVVRSQLDKLLTGVDEFRGQMKDQINTYATRVEMTAKMDSIQTDTKRNELKVAGLTSRADFDKLEDRSTKAEARLATWDGRLWALGTIFLLVNIFVSWFLSTGHVLAH